MSINQIVSPYKKPYLDGHFNDLTVDGLLTIDGAPFENPPVQALLGTVQGTLLVNPTVLTGLIKNIADVVTLTIRGLLVSFSNQNPSGNIDLVLPIPASIKPLSNFSYPVVATDTDGNGILTRLAYDFATDTFNLYASPSTRAFVRSTTNVSVPGDTTISWII